MRLDCLEVEKSPMANSSCLWRIGTEFCSVDHDWHLFLRGIMAGEGLLQGICKAE